MDGVTSGGTKSCFGMKNHSPKCNVSKANAGSPEYLGPTECNCDGYHTFDELYEHRKALWQALLSAYVTIAEEWGSEGNEVWKSKLHSDGTMFDGYFISGLKTEKGEQMTYHLPISEWGDCYGKELQKAPEFDGHTSDDVIARLKDL